MKKQSFFLRPALSFLFVVAVGYVVLALLGWFDGPTEKAHSEARKCGSARSINLLGDAEQYCRNAIEIVRRETKVQREVAALAHTETAALAIVQKRTNESVEHCQLALAAWRDHDEMHNRESVVLIPDAVRQESVYACEYLISVTMRQAPSVARVSEMQHDPGARVSAPVVLVLKADELRAHLSMGQRHDAVNAAGPDGDPGLAIAEVDLKIGGIDKVLRRHTYELRDATTRAPIDPSRARYRMTGQKGEVFYFEGPADPGSIDVNQVAVELFAKKNSRFVSYDAAWNEMQESWSSLSQANQRIARAKVLRHFDSKPSSVSPDEWEDRIHRSESSWHIR